MIFSLFLLLFDTVSSADIICPSLCQCDMTFGLRTARCTGQQINSVEVDFPVEVQHVDLSDNVISSLENYAFSVSDYLYSLCLKFKSFFTHIIGIKTA